MGSLLMGRDPCEEVLLNGMYRKIVVKRKDI